MDVPDNLLHNLYHRAFDVAYYAKDECRDHLPNKKRYWMDLGIKIESLYQAVEEFGNWEVRKSSEEREASQVERLANKVEDTVKVCCAVQDNIRKDSVWADKLLPLVEEWSRVDHETRQTVPLVEVKESKRRKKKSI